MTPELKAKWVAALRSGEYKQGQARMKRIHEDDTASYCCLGVLCEITGQVSQNNSFIVGPALHALGIENLDQHHLANLNDGSTVASQPALSFAQIADFIERVTSL